MSNKMEGDYAKGASILLSKILCIYSFKDCINYLLSSQTLQSLVIVLSLKHSEAHYRQV